MYNIIQLNDKNLSELQVIAKELGIKKADSFKKEELVYKILDEQAIAGATKKVAAEKLKEERKGDKNKRSRTAAPKKEEKVAPAAKNAEVTKNKENAPAAKPQQQPKEEAANKAKEAPVAEPKAEKAAPKRKVGRPRKDANIAEKAENKEVENAKPIVKPTEEKAVSEKTVVKYLWKVMVPLSLPTLISITILKMMGAWNSYVWPRLVANDDAHKLITNGLRNAFNSSTGETNYPVQMAAVAMVSFPLFLVFIFLRKYIMSGVSRSGIKG